MRKQHHIVGSLGPCFIHSLLNQLIESLRLQVIEQDAVGIIERITFKNHRLRSTDPNVGHSLIAVLMNHIGGKDGVWFSCFVEIDTGHRRTHLLQQLSHTGHSIVKLMVAQRESVVVHKSHDISDILSLRDGTRGVTLQIVTTTHHSSIGRIRTVDSITQTSHLRIAVNTAMHIVLVKNHDALLSHYHMTAHHQSHHTKNIFLHHLLLFTECKDRQKSRKNKTFGYFYLPP